MHTLRPFFHPRVIAVIGASRHRGSIGAEIFHNLVEGGFHGRTIPINPHADEIASIRAYPRVVDVADEIDLAVIAIPAAGVESAIDDCIAARVPAIVVITAGFGEIGDAGRTVEARLRDKVRAAGIRMIGPNCMGVLNADPAVQMNATFSPVFPPSGPIAFSSQSGALGLAILEYARRLNIGISSFASVGNKADVSSNDLIEYWADDPQTSVILLYLESFGNPRRFGEIARRVGKVKPIVAVKAGRSRAGARAACSHTGALASSDVVVDALFRDAGVIRTETLEELFDVATLVAHQPIPAGRRVAILTNAGGPGILAADACEALGLTVSPLAQDTVAALRSFLPATASVANPVDMIATASADHYRRALPLLLADPAVDAVLAIFIPPLVTNSADVARAIADAARASSKPVLANFFGAEGVPDILAPVPCYVFPEAAVRALAHAVTYGEWRARPIGIISAMPPSCVTVARSVVDQAVRRGGGWLSMRECLALLGAGGIRAAAMRVVASAGDAAAAASAIGYPVVVKGSGPALVHKTEAHAVFTRLHDADAVQRAYDALGARADVTEVVVQDMIEGGAEMMVGVTLDPLFGHVVMCGSGGTQVELLRDATCRLAPITDRVAAEMLDSIRGIALLRGFRGAPPADEAAFRDIVLRVSALLDACPEINDIDLNPVIVTTSGAHVVDVRVRIGSH